MRAVAAFPAEKEMRLVDHPAPRLGAAREVRIRMLEIGVCGTDREIARFDYGTPPPGAPYLVIGHESLGQVVEVGDAVSNVTPGDLVVTTVRRPCPHPHCRACRHGRQDFCFTGDFSERGIKGRHGFMTEEVVEDARYVHALPRELARVGVLVEPLTIAEKALVQVADVQDRLPWIQTDDGEHMGRGRRALVLGAGPVGLLGCLALLVRGFQTAVYSLEPAGSAKARWVESVGARYVPADDVAIPALDRELGHIDLVYEATGAAKVSFQALEELGSNGVFVFTGVPGRKGPIELDAARLMRRLVLHNQLVFGTVNAGPDAFFAAIDDLSRFHRRWPDQLEALITGRHDPADHAELLAGGGGIKEVVRFASPA